MPSAPARDRLYLLKPDFMSEGGVKQFCSECAMVEGMLSFYPQLRTQLDVRYIGFAKPRGEIVAEIGPEHQSSPCLVVADPARAAKLAPHVKLGESNGKRFVTARPPRSAPRNRDFGDSEDSASYSSSLKSP